MYYEKVDLFIGDFGVFHYRAGALPEVWYR